MSPETILAALLAYKTFKKVSVSGTDRPPGTTIDLHLRAFIALGHCFYILGIYFLLTSSHILILPLDLIYILAILAFMINDIQDLVYKKRPLLLYLVILLEFIFWASLCLISFMSAEFSAGSLLFIATISRIADLFFFYLTMLNEKDD